MTIWYKNNVKRRSKIRSLKWLLTALVFIPALTLKGPQFYGPMPATVQERLADYLAKRWKLDYTLAAKYVNLAIEHETKDGFPSRVDILAVAQVESGFKSTAQDPTSPSVGLMQINTVAHKVTIKQMKDPAKNIAKGSEILRKYRKIAKSDSGALVAYNAGPIGLINICGSRTTSCSSTYSSKVRRAKEELLQAMKG